MKRKERMNEEDGPEFHSFDFCPCANVPESEAVASHHDVDI